MTSTDFLEKHACEIVEDLLLLYAENNLNQPDLFADSNRKLPIVTMENNQTRHAFDFVTEHLKSCPACSNYLEMIQEDFTETETDRADIPIIHFRRKYHIRLTLGILCAVIAASGVLVLLL